MLDNKWELEDWINKFPSTWEILKEPFLRIKSPWVNYNRLACKFYWPRELRNHAQLVFFLWAQTLFTNFHKFICCCSWVMGTSKPTSNTMEVQNRFCLCFCFILTCFHCYMENPPTLALKDHDLRYHTCDQCVILNHSQKVCWKNRKEFGGICQNLWEL